MTFKSEHSKDFNLNQPSKNTEILLREINEATNIYTYLEKNTGSMNAPSFSEYFQFILEEKKIKKTALLYKTGLSRSYIYALLKGDRLPARDSVLNISLSIHCTMEETYNLLKYSGYQPLYARDLRDTIVLFGIKQRISLTEVNDILYDLNIETIGLN